MKRRLIVVSPRYELVRCFVIANHLHHDDVLAVRGPNDLRGEALADRQVVVLAREHLDRDVWGEIEAICTTAGAFLTFADPFQLVEVLG